MTEGEKFVLDDANEFIRQTSNLIDEAKQSTGIRPHPIIEESETVLETTRFGMQFAPEPLSESEPGGGGIEPPPTSNTLYVQFDLYIYDTVGSRSMFRLQDTTDDVFYGNSIDVTWFATNPHISFFYSSGHQADSANNSVPINTLATAAMKIDFAPTLPFVTCRLNGSDVGTFECVDGLSMARFVFGLTQNQNGDFELDNLLLGTTDWGSSDLFNADFTSAIIPPFDDINDPDGNLSVSGGRLLVANTGVHAYAGKVMSFP